MIVGVQRCREILAVFFACFLFTSTAIAQQPATSPPSLLPSDAALDKLLADRNWNQLTRDLYQPVTVPELSRKMLWLRSKILSGGGNGGFLLALVYSRDLWSVGSTLNRTGLDSDFRLTSAIYLLYAFELAVIDGHKCEDRSAPNKHVDQILTARAPVLSYLKEQPADVKNKIVDTAVKFEQKTVPARKDDDLVCRGGLAEMQASLKAGKQQEGTAIPGQIGKTIVVGPPPPDWTPKLVSPDAYLPLQEKARATIRERILKLVF